jgi:anthranilate phosphoribosyltransferase
VAAGRDSDFKAALQRAANVIDSDSAREKLDSLVEFTQRFTG